MEMQAKKTCMGGGGRRIYSQGHRRGKSEGGAKRGKGKLYLPPRKSRPFCEKEFSSGKRRGGRNGRRRDQTQGKGEGEDMKTPEGENGDKNGC